MKNVFETLVGAIVLVVALGFVITAYKTGSVKEVSGYTLVAKFDRADGLSEGSDVRVSGIKVGSVTEQTIEPGTYMAIVKMSVEDDVKLPNDSSAEIIGTGLIGNKYVALVPGGAEEMFKNNDQIKITQPSISLESLIGKFIFGSADDKNKDKKKNGADGSAATTDQKDEDDVF